MTITEARKILGNEAKNMSNIEVAREIEAASLFKNLFFKIYTQDIKKQNNSSDLTVKTVQ